jgi:hypothetical protein
MGMDEGKFLIGIFARPEELSGVLDVIRDYPTQGEWWLGVLMLEPARRGEGLCEGVCRAVEQWVLLARWHCSTKNHIAGQTRTVLSQEAEARCLPSCDQETERTLSV